MVVLENDPEKKEKKAIRVKPKNRK